MFLELWGKVKVRRVTEAVCVETSEAEVVMKSHELSGDPCGGGTGLESAVGMPEYRLGHSAAEIVVVPIQTSPLVSLHPRVCSLCLLVP